MGTSRTASLFVVVVVVGSLVVVSAGASAQVADSASIAGVVRDASGAVLPGVTVEAASPALIDKVRSVVTDGQGLYRIVDLRPGVYTVTFSLPGFSSLRREGVELTTGFTAAINAFASTSVGAASAVPTVGYSRAATTMKVPAPDRGECIFVVSKLCDIHSVAVNPTQRQTVSCAPLCMSSHLQFSAQRE